MLVKRAQTTIETLIILGAALFILTALVAIVYNQLESSYVQEQQQLALSALGTLAKEADDTYFLGPGTVKSVIINFPELVDLNKSYISGKALVLSVNNSDIVKDTRVEVRGVWPNSGGSFVFTLTAFDDFVLISTQRIGVSPTQVVESIKQGSARDVNIFLANNTTETINYLVDTNFPFTGTGATLSSSSGSISVNAGESSYITLTLSCSRESFGSYSGVVTFSAQASSDSNISVPINVVCSSSQTKLSIYPSTKNIYSYPNETFNDSIFICNNSLTNFSYSKSSIVGPISDYVLTTFSESIPANSCKTAILNFNAPATEGSYSGLLNIEASGFVATADLNLVVSSLSNTLDVYWNKAYFASDSNKIVDANIINLGAFVVVEEVMVLFLNDISDANVTNFYVRGVDKAPASTKTGSGEWINVTDFNVGAQKSYDLNIVFDANINDDSEKFRVVFKLSNGQYLWSQIFDPTSTVVDNLQKHFSDSNIGVQPIYPADENLVGLWRFNGSVDDSVGSANGTNFGSSLITCLWGSECYDHNGSGSHVRLTNDLIPYSQSEYAISTWIYIDGGQGTYRGILNQYPVHYFELTSSNTVRCGDYNTTPSFSGVTSNTVFETNRWYHIVCTANKTTLQKKIYVNGVLDKLDVMNGGDFRNSTSYYRVGWAEIDNRPFDGKIEEFALWNKALSLNEVQEIYSIGAGKYDFNTQGTSSGLALKGSPGSYLSDGNFYSRVFDFNGTVDPNSISWTTSFSGTALGSTKLDHTGLLSNYNSSYFSYKSSDKNHWTASGSLDWNAKDFGSELKGATYSEISSTDTRFFDQNLIGLWHMNLNTLDSSSYHNDATTAAFNGDENTSGLWDTNGFYFDGLNDHLEVTDNNNFDYLGGEMTWSIWVKPDLDENDVGYLFSKPWNAVGVYNYRFQYTANFALSVTFEGATSSTVTSDNNVIKPGYWNHVVLTINSSRRVKMYVNGLMVKYATQAVTNWTPATLQEIKLSIGMIYPWGNNPAEYTYYSLKGKVDEAAIWNRELTQLEIIDLYRSQMGSVLDENLVGLWHFNNNLNDSSSSFNLTNSGIDYTTGLWDTNAGNFDGADYAYVADSAVLDNNTNSFTWSFWAKHTTTALQRVLAKFYYTGDNSGYAASFNWPSAGNFTFCIYSGTASCNNGVSTTGGGITNDGKWHMNTAVVDREKNTLTIYVDGTYITAGSIAGIGGLNTSDDLYIGKHRTLGNNYTGLMDDLSLWARALSPNEVKAMYESQKGKWLDPNLVFYYKLDSSSGSNVIDSARAINGTLAASTNLNATGMWDSNALNCGTTSNAYYITTADRAELKVIGDQTIRMWIHPTNVAAGRENPYNKAYGGEGTLTQETNGSMSYYYGTGGGNASPYQGFGTTAGAIQNNVWTYIAIVRNLSGTSTLTWYVNGVQNNSAGASYAAAVASAGPIYIGTGYSVAYSGYIDEVAEWNRALSATEILADYNRFANSKFVQNNPVAVDYNSLRTLIKVNSDTNYNFGSEISSADTKFFDQNLIGLWHLNGDVIDSSGNGYNGTLYNASVSSGLWDTNAYSFDGSGDYIDLGASLNSTFSTAKPFSVNLWFKATTSATDTALFSNADWSSPYTGFEINLLTAGTLRVDFVQTISGNKLIRETTNTSLRTNTWNNLVVTYDGAYSSNGLKIFVNGIEQVTTVAFNGIDGAAISVTPLEIGSRDVTNIPFTGKIEEVAVWNRALSNNEIVDLYRKGVSRLDLNIYSCNDAGCTSKRQSGYISNAKNNYLYDTNLVNGKYFGFDAYFLPYSYSDFSLAGNYYVNSFVKDFNVGYSYVDENLSMRTSSNGVTWGDWNYLTTSPLALLDEAVKYFQYKMHLRSNNPNATPLLSDVNLVYTR